MWILGQFPIAIYFFEKTSELVIPACVDKEEQPGSPILGFVDTDFIFLHIVIDFLRVSDHVGIREEIPERLVFFEVRGAAKFELKILHVQITK